MLLQRFSMKIVIATVMTLVSLVSSRCYDQEINIEKFEIVCPDDHSDFKIICHSDDWANFLVKLHLTTVRTIQFEHCSFPEKTSMQNIFQSMDITVYETVKFTKLQSSPIKQNLKGLSVTKLEVSDGTIDKIPYDLLYDLSNLEELKISNTHLIRIPENFFANWSENIVEIHLAKNRLEKITKNNFAHLINVKTVDLAHNAINEIEPGALDNLLNLRKIQLGANQLHTLSSSIFHRLSRLIEIELNNNYFDELPQDLLIKTKNLKSFSMYGNQGKLKALPNGFFKGLFDLETAFLNGNRLEFLPSNLFTGCSKLIQIDLTYNHLRNLPAGLFNDTRNLHTIKIATNRLESLPAGIFKGLNRLKYLSVYDNQLTTLTSDILRDLQSLEFFDASKNNLTTIDNRFIFYLKSARIINLSTNRLTFENLDNIESFENLSTNGLEKTFANIINNQTLLPPMLHQDIEMQLTYLNDNRITKINAAVMNILKYSRQVHLNGNHISKINLTYLSTGLAARKGDRLAIYLENNPFHCDCDIIDFVSYVNGDNKERPFAIVAKPSMDYVYEDLYGEDIYFCATPSTFKGRSISRLRPEELSCPFKTNFYNDACNGTCTCQEYPANQVLLVDCSNRNLTKLPPTIGIGHNWTIQLNMSGNMLRNAPSLSDSYLENIICLDLSNNNIDKVSIDLFSPKLRYLKLHGNSISRLDPNVIEYLAHNNSLQNVTFHDNKWICDCETRQFLNFVKKQFTKYRFQDIMCYGTNKKLDNMNVGELCEDAIVITVVISLLIALFGIIAILVGLYYRYQEQIKIWSYSKNLCLWLVTEDELDKDKEYDAFISFSHRDEEFVEKEIIAKLEGSPRPYKLCLHYRDWLAGEWIPIQINRSVAESRRTIVVLTPNFLESVWGLLEFRAAHTQALKEGRARLIVILCGDIGNINDLDEELKDYLRLNTYIKWGDPWFWDKLQYALPHGKQLKKRESQNVKDELV